MRHLKRLCVALLVVAVAGLLVACSTGGGEGLPRGLEAERPSGEQAGDLFWATDTQRLFYWTGETWKIFGQRTLVFTVTGTLPAPSESLIGDFRVIAPFTLVGQTVRVTLNEPATADTTVQIFGEEATAVTIPTGVQDVGIEIGPTVIKENTTFDIQIVAGNGSGANLRYEISE